MPATTKFFFTDNFKDNLREIAQFLHDAHAGSTFLALLDEIDNSIIPNLARFPNLGRPFMQRTPHSVETSLKLPTLQGRLDELGLGTELREYLLQNYLILYTIKGNNGFFLAIKHHRQLGFDFSGLWNKTDYPPNQAIRGKLLLQQERARYDHK